MNARPGVALTRALCQGEITRCVITTADGQVLAGQLSLDQAHSLIRERESDPVKYPDWQGDLVVKVIPDGDRRRTPARITRRGYIDGLDLTIKPGAAPALVFTGCTVGLAWPGEEDEWIEVACGDWSANIDIELALYHLDDFEAASRARLVGMLGHYYGVLLLRGAA